MDLETIKQRMESKQDFAFIVTKKECVACENLKLSLINRDVEFEEWEMHDNVFSKGLPIDLANAVLVLPSFVIIKAGEVTHYLPCPSADDVEKYYGC